MVRRDDERFERDRGRVAANGRRDDDAPQRANVKVAVEVELRREFTCKFDLKRGIQYENENSVSVVASSKL